MLPQEAPEALPRVYREPIKISSYLWALARYLQVNQIKRVTRFEIVDALSYPSAQQEHKFLNNAIESGLLKRIRLGLYDVNLDVADKLVHRIPLGYVELSTILAKGNPYMKEAEELWSAWNAFVNWHNAGANPVDLPLGAVHVLERYGIRPFVEIKAPNGLDVFVVDMKDIKLIMDRLTKGPYVYCSDYQGAKLCAFKKYMLLRYLVMAPSH